MSRWLEKLPDGTYKEDIYDRDGCKWLVNEVCCNDRCNWCCDFPAPEEDCKICEYFEKEDDETE